VAKPVARRHAVPVVRAGWARRALHPTPSMACCAPGPGIAWPPRALGPAGSVAVGPSDLPGCGRRGDVGAGGWAPDGRPAELLDKPSFGRPLPRVPGSV